MPGRSIANFGNSLMNLGQSIHSNNMNQQTNQQAEQARTRADEQAIAVGSFQNQFNLQTRAVQDQMQNIMRGFNSHTEMQNYDIGGWIAEQRDAARGMLDQFAYDPMLQDRMRNSFEASWFQFENGLFNVTRGAYSEMVSKELDSNLSALSQSGDMAGIDEYEATLLGAFKMEELATDDELQSIMELEQIIGRQDQFINQGVSPDETEAARNRREQAERELQRLQMEISGRQKEQGQLLYTPEQIRQAAEAYRKQAAGVVLEQQVSNMTPSQARQFILEGETDLHTRFTRAERQEIAGSMAQQQTIRQQELNIENNQRIQDNFNRITTLSQARGLLNHVLNSNNGVTQGNLPGTYLNSNTQQSWINALRNDIERMEYEALPEEVRPEPPPEPPDFLNSWYLEVGSGQLTTNQARSDLNRLVGLTPEEGGITHSQYSSALTFLNREQPGPDIRAAMSFFDQQFPTNSPRSIPQNARAKDMFNQAMLSVMRETGMGYDSVTQLNQEQVMQIAQNINQEIRENRVRELVSAGDVRQSILGTNNSLFFNTQPVEKFVQAVENGRFLGYENDPEYRERALFLAGELGSTLSEKINNPNTGHSKDGNYIFGLLAPQGTTINATDIEIGRGLLPQVFVESPYRSQFTVEINGRFGYIISAQQGFNNDLEYVMYDPTRQQNGGSNLTDYRPIRDPQVHSILQQSTNRATIQTYQQNQTVQPPPESPPERAPEPVMPHSRTRINNLETRR